MTTTVGQQLANNTLNNNSKTANTSETTTRTTTANSQQSPRNARKCPQSTLNTFTITLLTLAVLMCASSGGNAGVGLTMAAPTAAPNPAPAATAFRFNTVRSSNRTRLQKRHYNNSKAQFYNELNSPVLHWSNACGGKWMGPEVVGSNSLVRPHKRCAQHKKLLRTLQYTAGGELKQLRRDNKLRHTVHSLKAQNTATNQAIDLSQHRIWVTQSGQYNFLPRLNNSGQQLSLRRAHNDLQFYVAAFSYLRHAQTHYDYENLQRQSVLSTELLRLRTSARTVLCIVEEAINGSSQLYAPSQKHQRQQMLPLGGIKTVTRHVMEKRLQQFQTPLVELHRQAVLAANNQPAAKPTKPPVELDMLFIKYQYIEYLKHMTQLLAKQRKKKCVSRSPKVASQLPQTVRHKKQQRTHIHSEK